MAEITKVSRLSSAGSEGKVIFQSLGRRGNWMAGVWKAGICGMHWKLSGSLLMLCSRLGTAWTLSSELPGGFDGAQEIGEEIINPLSANGQFRGESDPVAEDGKSGPEVSGGDGSGE